MIRKAKVLFDIMFRLLNLYILRNLLNICAVCRSVIDQCSLKWSNLHRSHQLFLAQRNEKRNTRRQGGGYLTLRKGILVEVLLVSVEVLVVRSSSKSTVTDSCTACQAPRYTLGLYSDFFFSKSTYVHGLPEPGG